MTQIPTRKFSTLLALALALACASSLLGGVLWVQNARIRERISRLEAQRNIWSIGTAARIYTSQFRTAPTPFPVVELKDEEPNNESDR